MQAIQQRAAHERSSSHASREAEKFIRNLFRSISNVSNSKQRMTRRQCQFSLPTQDIALDIGVQAAAALTRAVPSTPMDPEQRKQYEDDEKRAQCIKEAKDAESTLQKDIQSAARLEGKLATTTQCIHRCIWRVGVTCTDGLYLQSL